MSKRNTRSGSSPLAPTRDSLNVTLNQAARQRPRSPLEGRDIFLYPSSPLTAPPSSPNPGMSGVEEDNPSQDINLRLQQQQHRQGDMGSQSQPPFDMRQLQLAAEATAAAAQAAADALRAATGGAGASKKKPDLPKFDPRNVEIWIKRVESAYIRAGITKPSDKFAFVETQFPVDYNPRINEYLYAFATDVSWSDFLNYLRQEYGRTRQQQAATMIDGIKRDGRKPSQYLATLVDLTKDVTVDEIRKELLLRELPSDIKRTIANGIKEMSASEVAELADDHFDREGRQLHRSHVNSIEEAEAPRTVHFEEEKQDEEVGDEVNMVHRQSKRPPSRNRASSRGPSGYTAPFGSNNNNNDRSASRERRSFSGQRNRSQASNPTLCFYHKKFGKAAKQCSDGCTWKNQNSGNDSRSRRK